ncbi:UNVERIFIED_CONTAM: hypothetical protein HDU68_011213 [Siphonaria sp. JEL0065]|nr:hypothetical protein HDU68_011213 [Siphonaria sp. JEL0065]
MVGYFFEYLVACRFAMHHNPNNPPVTDRISSSTSDISTYILQNRGPDVVYFDSARVVYIAQIKFVDTISKQERLNATDPQQFTSNNGVVLRGYEEAKKRILVTLWRNGTSGVTWYSHQNQNNGWHVPQLRLKVLKGTSLIVSTREFWAFMNQVRSEFQGTDETKTKTRIQIQGL